MVTYLKIMFMANLFALFYKNLCLLQRGKKDHLFFFHYVKRKSVVHWMRFN